MARVFLSHASTDRELAQQWHAWLAGAGHQVFLDQDLHDGLSVGDRWQERLDAAGGRGWADGRCPYPGLRAFDTAWQRVFFGRHAETAALAELLRSAAEQLEGRLLVVEGPSGCGKSSLVRAGLQPVIADE